MDTGIIVAAKVLDIIPIKGVRFSNPPTSVQLLAAKLIRTRNIKESVDYFVDRKCYDVAKRLIEISMGQ